MRLITRPSEHSSCYSVAVPLNKLLDGDHWLAPKLCCVDCVAVRLLSIDFPMQCNAMFKGRVETRPGLVLESSLVAPVSADARDELT